MAIKTVSTYKEVLEQIRTATAPCYFTYSCEFELDGVVIPTVKVIAIDQAHDYVNGFAPSFTITVAMYLDVYERDLYPVRNKVRAVLKKTPLNGTLEVPGISNLNYYTVVPLDHVDRAASTSVDYDPSRGMGNFTFQLIPAPIEKLRLETCGGCFVDCTTLDVLMVLLGEATKRRATTGDTAFQGFSKVDAPKEMRVKPQIIIPHGTPVLDLPSYLQRSCGGIYNHSIGCYYYANKWYTFPIYDTGRYDRTKRVLDIAILPPTQALGYEKTYAYTNQRAFVLSTSSFQAKDTRDRQHLLKGNGVRFSNASQIWDSFAPTQGNKSTTDLTKNVSQFVITEREDGNQSVPFSDTGITDNICEELSKINARNGREVVLTWKNANPDILYPGMPVKIHYPMETGTKEALGVLLETKVFVAATSGQMTTEKMASEIALKIFLAD